LVAVNDGDVGFLWENCAVNLDILVVVIDGNFVVFCGEKVASCEIAPNDEVGRA